MHLGIHFRIAQSLRSCNKAGQAFEILFMIWLSPERFFTDERRDAALPSATKCVHAFQRFLQSSGASAWSIENSPRLSAEIRWNLLSDLLTFVHGDYPDINLADHFSCRKISILSTPYSALIMYYVIFLNNCAEFSSSQKILTKAEHRKKISLAHKQRSSQTFGNNAGFTAAPWKTGHAFMQDFKNRQKLVIQKYIWNPRMTQDEILVLSGSLLRKIAITGAGTLAMERASTSQPPHGRSTAGSWWHPPRWKLSYGWGWWASVKASSTLPGLCLA